MANYNIKGLLRGICIRLSENEYDRYVKAYADGRKKYDLKNTFYRTIMELGYQQLMRNRGQLPAYVELDSNDDVPDDIFPEYDIPDEVPVIQKQEDADWNDFLAYKEFKKFKAGR